MTWTNQMVVDVDTLHVERNRVSGFLPFRYCRFLIFNITCREGSLQVVELQKMADTTSGTKLTMKLLVDPRPLRPRVLFAEAGKDAVDFLFSLLAMPAGAAVKLLGKDSMMGSVGNLYASAEELDGTYVQPGAAKDAILCPTVLSPPSSSLFRFPEPSSVSTPRSFFGCDYQNSFGSGGCRTSVTNVRGTRCPFCGNQMTTESRYVPGQVQNTATSGGKGFVQAGVTYTVDDDLRISPMSAISSITRLGTLAARDLGVLQEKTVQIGYKEGLEILEASFKSKTVLTDVFLGKKLPPSNSGTTLSRNATRYECLTWRV
ncbi:unnamed protein product [Alopecurus aequalis]